MKKENKNEVVTKTVTDKDRISKKKKQGAIVIIFLYIIVIILSIMFVKGLMHQKDTIIKENAVAKKNKE